MVNFDFSGRVVLITAASKGIGFAIAKNFYKAGAKVAICSRNKISLINAIKEIAGSSQENIVGFCCDLTNLIETQKLVSKVEDHFGSSVDILVNNSGGPPPMSISETKLENWENAINQNLLSSILITQSIIPSMEKNGFGRIIYLTSTASKEPAENMVLSNVTRAGVAAFSKTLSREIPPNSSITINTILTGGCRTDRLYSLVENQAIKNNESSDDLLKKLSANVPVGYFATPDEFSKTILFLASEEASYVNGIALPLDGGVIKGIF
jgi:3-oxoacyl-[acyl-carrier protein] reductase